MRPNASTRGPGKRYTEPERDYFAATRAQLDYLAHLGYKPPGRITKLEAGRQIERLTKGRDKLPATNRQKALLISRGRWREGMTLGEAYDMIFEISVEEHWHR